MNLKLKLKYKKVIFAVSLATMGIGLAILSINTKEDIPTNNPKSSISSPVAGKPSTSPSPTESAQEDATTKEILKAKLEKNASKEVNAVVTKYLEASVKADVDTLKTVLSQSEKITKEELQRRYEYIEGVSNIDCYTLPGLDENSYITYVYYESKIVNIETMAPGLIYLYVTKDANGKMVIMVNELDSAIKEQMELALKREDVQELIQTVNSNLQQALSEDANLKEFMEKLKDAVEHKSSETPATSQKPGSSAAPEKSTAPVTSAKPAASPAATKSAKPATNQ